MDFIEDAACQGMELTRILRVACLHSVISNGLKPKTLEMYRKLLLQAYGHVHLTSLINLEKSKLLCCNSKYFIVISRKKYLFILFLCEKKNFFAGNSTSSSTSNVYSLLRKRLHLTQDGVNEQEPNDITYVHR